MMRIPRFVISGDRVDSTNFVVSAIIKSGYPNLTGINQQSLEVLARDHNVLVLYVSSFNLLSEIPGVAPVRSDPFRASANVVLCLSEEIGRRELQLSQFIAAVADGTLSTVERGQYWRHSLLPVPTGLINPTQNALLTA